MFTTKECLWCKIAIPQMSIVFIEFPPATECHLLLNRRCVISSIYILMEMTVENLLYKKYVEMPGF